MCVTLMKITLIICTISSLFTCLSINHSECAFPQGFFLNGFCYYVSSDMHNLYYLSKTSKNQTSQQICASLNGTVAAVLDHNDMFQLIDWIRSRYLNRDNELLATSQMQNKFLMALELSDGKLHWIEGNEKIRVDQYESLKFVHSYDRGIRLLCPALDIPYEESEEPMFVTVHCARKLPVICKTLVNPCYKSPCGSGKCVNIMNKYKCLCPLFRSGVHCENYSRDAIQTMISIALILIGITILIVKELQQIQVEWWPKAPQVSSNFCLKSDQSSAYETHNPHQPPPFQAVATEMPNRLPYTKINYLCAKCIGTENSAATTATTSVNLLNTSFFKSKSPFRRRNKRSLTICYNCNSNLTNNQKPSSLASGVAFAAFKTAFIFTSIIITITANMYIYLSRTLSSQQLRNSLIRSINNNDSTFEAFLTELGEHQNHTICKMFNVNILDKLYRIPASKITLPFFVALTAFTVLLSRRKSKKWCCGGYIAIPMVYNPFSKANRLESASVFGILALEVLHIFDEFIFNANNYMSYGPLFDLFKQTGLVVLIGARYFPILATFELDPPNLACFGLAGTYIWIEIFFKTGLDAYCPPRIPKNISLSKLTLLLTYRSVNGTTASTVKNASISSVNSMDDDNFWQSLWLSSNSIHLNIFKQLPYYLFSCFLAGRLTFMFFMHAYHKLSGCQLFNFMKRQNQTTAQANDARLPNLFNHYNYPYCNQCRLRTIAAVEPYIYHFKSTLSNELKYVQRLFNRMPFRSSKKSLLHYPKTFLKKIYPWRSDFVFSKQVMNIYVIAFTLIYYFTFWTLEHSQYIVNHVFRLIQFGLLYTFSKDPANSDLKTLDNLRSRVQQRIVDDLKILSCMCASFCCFQLFLGMKSYQKQILSAYRGNFETIPHRRRFTNTVIVSKALHYPGYMIGYLIWGYLFLLVMSFTIFVLFKNVVRMIDIMEALARWLIPMLVLLLLKLVLIKVLSKTIFTQNNGRCLALTNTKLLYAFNYFNFFFDCFLGLLMCISRISQASLAALLLLSRLDQSMFGRGLERYDKGFTAYTCWIHLETIQTHPVLIIFSEVARVKIVNRRALMSRLLVEYDSMSRTCKVDRVASKNFLQTEFKKYESKERAKFRYWLAWILIKNPWLIQFRKYRLQQQQQKQRLRQTRQIQTCTAANFLFKNMPINTLWTAFKSGTQKSILPI